ncbi:MacB family efflux pump subunit [Paracoccus contaminans]|uniref:Pyoverdine export ATP-binding/permease protein PvdT n=1 Tax=Paracoccus contaminans TaxID=1945662 RepID=A0A1W6CUN1_9RHOB|nr:MacB family efflux pump subunit [Paracoccus contaminans]ARJ68577.1 macrolide ABC transporter permease/ATP-binding protein MacB [Paracoccus contaminans]
MAAPSPHPLIAARNITRSFAAGDQVTTVLHGVDLDIHAGEFVAIIGASGSGKSTLMNILGCLDRPSSGLYRFDGQDVSRLGPDRLAELRREHFGFIFQRYQLLGDLDAIGNVEVPAIYAGEAAGPRRTRARQLLDRLGLGSRVDHRPSELSGGQQQRVSVARALMNGGEVILADEPTGALDTASSAELIALLEQLNAQGHTIIMVTHDPKVAAHAHRVIEISDGRIVADRRNDRMATGAGAGIALALPDARRAATGSALTRLGEALQMAMIALNAHRMRSFLTMLGIIIGIASVVLVVALGAGTQEKVLQNISSLGTNTITIRAGQGFGARDANRIKTLVPSDARALAQQDYAKGVSPAVSASATGQAGGNEASVQISGVTNDYFALRSYVTVTGSQFDAADLSERNQVAVIDEDTRNSFFGAGADPLGQTLLLGHVPVRIIGVVRSSGASFGPSALNVWLPYTTVMTRVSGQRNLDSITVQVEDGHDMTEAQNRINALLLERHGTQDFFLQNSDTIRSTITSTARTLTLLVAAIAVISLVVGGIGVMNIMLVSVTERTREIGVRIAIGARRSDIVAQFLIEAVLVCLVGGILGVALALSGGALIGWLSESIRLSFSMLSIAVAFLSSTLIGVAFGYLPARSAAELDPVVALARE